MDMLTVKNRSDQEVVGMWDGRQYVLPPLGTEAFPEVVARAIKRQNPVRGTGDPRLSEAGLTGKMQYKVGIVELKDPCEPLGTFVEGPERWNREYLPGGNDVEIVRGKSGIYSARDVASPLALDPTIMISGHE